MSRTQGERAPLRMRPIALLTPNHRRLRSPTRLQGLALCLGLAVAACGSSDGGSSSRSGASAGAANASTGGHSAAGGSGSGGAGATSGGAGGFSATAGISGAGASAGGAGGSATGGSSAGGRGGSDDHAGSGGSAAGSGGSGGSTSLPPHLGKWRITPLGDSITGTTCGPQLLSKSLLDQGKTNFSFVGSNLNNQSCNGAPNVQTEGHGGYLVTDLVGNGQHAAELPMWTSTDKADLVLMQFGTNDVWNNRDPAQILSAFATILSDLRAANANVILLVAQITPLNPAGCEACESRVETLNSQIPGWAASKSTTSSPVSVVDLHSLFDAVSYKPSSNYTADGVHPNVAGAQLIANKWYGALGALGAP